MDELIYGTRLKGDANMYILKANDHCSGSYTADGQPGCGHFGFQVLQAEQQQNVTECDNPTDENIRRKLTSTEGHLRLSFTLLRIRALATGRDPGASPKEVPEGCSSLVQNTARPELHFMGLLIGEHVRL
ncbi:hypothetical protein WISP_68416 [Willisornis vidua]|uniref:Uncharacterized protein n=1 Tax=Willisornis vidua TaxID=1566151 RepID=A0ABQ9D899_9PASS|nr:hypothetical protein WISP_68416 [Willisornis vidua]